ncbi:MAG TPA: phosphoribosylglycinamide formyltransferase [Pseudothermotoga sp.]|uniref:phosphoribosylglycinamide formyltransferase n=1 Tax=Pseudothermotoga lettingae TaxID=177758 RepID=UPI00074A6F5A|nr:phosphoribosylglycinamide formyltransferase [Pseudothermotoga lettingae]KUK21864.1 MAG: Phosphoribosylglycinamide formyltransferase [Pseudothermotoga lettingae]HBT26693.1 phosphoribosylglycinamide formyltransferase [Pseudothermotoga sp.]
MILKIGVLASGNGTNLQAIIDKSKNGQIPVRVAVVISDRNAFALRRARDHNIPAYIVKPGEYDSQREYEQQMVDILKKHGSELVVLSGFMKILSPHFIDSFKGRIINIHPSLIPAFCGKGFYGMKVHEAVIDYGVKITGATVHFVDENVDSGPIIIQKAVAVEDSDTPETIAQKVHEIEHEILPEALKLFAQGKLKVIGRRVFIER